MHPITPLKSRVPHGALVMLERSAGKLARSVLRGLGGRDPAWLPGGARLKQYVQNLRSGKMYHDTSP
jgi:hypothetical protein